VDSGADLTFVQPRVQRRLACASGELEAHFLAEPAHAELPRQRRGQHHRADPSERLEVEVPCERASELRQARIGPDQLDRPAAARADRVRAGFQDRRGQVHAGDAANLRECRLREALRLACEQLQRRVAGDPVGQLGDRALQARARNLRGEQQRHARGDADQREELLQQPRAEPNAVEDEDVERLHLSLVSPAYSTAAGGALGCEYSCPGV
jgi:hypothetical protein